MSTEAPDPRDLPAAIADDDGDRPSITGVHGNVAHFEMAYSPLHGERFAFGPPFIQRVPSIVFLGISIVVAAIAMYARFAPSNSELYIWIVEGDKNRPLGSGMLAAIILLSGIGTVLRSQMRGVVVSSDGIEARDILVMGMPRVRKWSWPQIDRVVLDDSGVMLELWDNTYARLPRVAKGRELADLLERVATGRGRGVTRLDRG